MNLALDLPTLTALAMLAGLTLYALFGGADFGGGVWDLLAFGPRAGAQRRVIAEAMGPVWEANHVWLIVVVVILFTAFPSAFAVVMTGLHVPLTLMLIGIVLRGSAFTFRAYDVSDLGRERWNQAFSVPSLLTPILLGMAVGAVATGRLEQAPGVPAPGASTAWLGPFPVLIGLFALSLFMYLAAVYLTLETDDPALRDDFRGRAIAMNLVAGGLAYGVYALSAAEAPEIHRGLGATPWGFPVRVATAIVAGVAFVALLARWFGLARIAAMSQMVLVLLGCGLAMGPNLVPPFRTIANSAAPAVTLKLLLGALAAGSLVLFPSIYYLFRIFKGPTFQRSRTRATPDR